MSVEDLEFVPLVQSLQPFSLVSDIDLHDSLLLLSEPSLLLDVVLGLLDPLVFIPHLSFLEPVFVLLVSVDLILLVECLLHFDHSHALMLSGAVEQLFGPLLSFQQLLVAHGS